VRRRSWKRCEQRVAEALGGEVNRRIAAQYSLSEASIRRHKAGHLAAVLQEAARADEEARDLNVLAEVRRLYHRAVGILDQASQEPRTALAAIREARETLALVLHRAGRPHADLVVLKLADFKEWFGGVNGT
jgi:hypothetical protein